ncbi:MAG: hypothetical protein ACLGPM_03990 [Acidobacteriota bacterium]
MSHISGLRRYLARLAQQLGTHKRLLALGGAGLGCLVLAGLWAGYLGFDGSLPGTGAKKGSALTVKPGNAIVHRDGNQLIFAHVTGIRPGNAHLFVRFQSATGWEPATMEASPDPGGGTSYRFIFAGIPENVEYYVTAGPLTSPHYHLHVVDLPPAKTASLTIAADAEEPAAGE